jgi:diguanylate cyclase (GGDEF)-like protein
VTISVIKLRALVRSVLRPSNIVGAVAVAVVVGSGLFADYQNRTVYEQRLRADVANRVSLIRAKLEGNINGNLQLVRGLISVIASEPNMTQDRFAALARNLFRDHSQLRNVAAAPNMVLSMIYPVKGNEKAVGIDYNTFTGQRRAALRARDSSSVVLAGPMELVQGGQAFVARFPVYVQSGSEPEHFWGIVSAVVDVQRLYADSGLFDADLPIDIVLVGRDGLGAGGETFYGQSAVLHEQPVRADVALPSGSWQIAAVPKGGWAANAPDLTGFRLLIVIAGGLVLVPLLVAGRLIDERQRHIRELGNREEQLEVLSRRLGLALDTSEIGVWEYHIESERLVWDDRMNELYGLPSDGAARAYDHWKSALHPDDLIGAEQEFATALETRGRYLSEYRVKLPGDTVRHIRAMGAVYMDANGTSRIVGVNWDVSADFQLNAELKRVNGLTEARNAELVAATARIERNALHDALTGLPNRRYIDEVLEARSEECRANGGSVALLHIDLDRFKQINDTLGHAAGDAMLIHASEVLRVNVRDDDFIGRIGGDEFVVVVNLARKGPKYLANLADRIITHMRQPVPYEGHECRFGVSVGIAYERGKAVDGKRLLVDADIALYRAKSQGRNRYEFFTDALQAEIFNTKRMADEILSGIENQEFVAYYQPQFDTNTLEICGVEALARWQHPTRGIVPPDVFLPIAEELNVVATIDRMILEQTLQHFGRWQTLGLGIPRASVNVSARRLADENLIKNLQSLDIRKGTISFELVESIYLDESDAIVAWNIDHIKDLGIDIEIDDFGTGYASIISLLKLRPRRLKIDRQLVMPIVGSKAQTQLIASIIEIGHSLGIAVVAEGVETHEHTKILKELGCDVLQGYAFSRPLSAEALEQFVAKAEWLAA